MPSALKDIGAKVEAGHKLATILDTLSIVRRVLSLAVRDDLITRDPRTESVG